MRYTIKHTLTVLCLLLAAAVHAQTIERKVINTMGGTLAPSGGPQLTHNVGETFSTTLVAGGYSLTQGFLQYMPVTVPPITGTLTVCVGATTTLSDSMSGGTWSSSNTSVATVGSTGIVTGVAAGTSTISYTVSGSSATAVVTVIATPTVSAMSLYSGAMTIGQTFQGGKVAYILQPGDPGYVAGRKKGFIAAPSDQSAGIKWGIYGTYGAITATAIGTGASNTAALIPIHGTGTAAHMCDTLTLGGYADWFLPSKDELNKMYLNKVAIGGFSGADYWASSERDANVAWAQYFVNGDLSMAAGKDQLRRVRAIRYFDIGSSELCIGDTLQLTNTTGGGTWTSSNTAVATVGTNGKVTAVTAGTATISYTVSNSCGSATATVNITVNTTAASITGASSVCAGATTTLSNTTPGGTWSSSNTAVATVGSTGIVTGVATGTAVISYTLSGTCSSTKTITINASPTAIGGTLNGCIGMTNTLTCTPAGGAWSSSTPSVANINTSGQATGYAAGTTTISYSLSTGCRSTAVLTINTLPDSVSGVAVVCAGLTTTLTGYPSGGNWTSGSTSVATVNAGGVVTGVALGTARITYNNAGGCYKIRIVTVNAAPLAITGTAAVCVGNTTTLACPGGGTWSSSNMAVGTVNTSGVVRGLTAGTTTITYRLSTGCINTRIVTVNNAPAAITGTASICAGTTTTLSSTTTGGTWSSSGLTVGTVGSITGVVTGITGGVVTISYTIAGGCRTTRVVTVNNNPPTIGGTATLATGGTTTLTNSMTGGSWSSGNTAVATVGSTGLVTGISSGTARISYTSAAGCSATKVVTVSGTIGSITGTTTVCTGTTTLLSCSPAGGVWSSSNTAVANVSASSGLVTGVSAGTARISYIVSGSSVTTVVTVFTMPAAISGLGTVCSGLAINLTSSTGGGSWSSSNTVSATVGSTGGVTGVAVGTSIISYSMGGGCVTTKTITVNTTPGAVGGTLTACVGSAATLTCTPTGGAWSIDSSSIATVSSGGSLTGVAAGTATISYTMGTGCRSTAVVTINAIPAAITGTLSVCAGSTTALSTSTTGGSWTSSNTTVATIGSTGVVSGLTAGNTTIVYTAGGCSTTAVVTVQPTPSAISGALAVCEGNTGTLTNASTGGTWLSDNTAVATIGSSSGTVTGVAAGTANVTYTVSTGCAVMAVVTVNGVPGSITGTGTVCTGTTTTLSCTPSGGTWETTTPSIATVGSATGIVTGVSAGTAVVTYSAGSGCYSTTVVTINPIPATPAGTASVCEGATATLTSTTGGGSWSSSNTAAATVNSSGVVTGVAAGTADIAYTLATGCQSVRTVTVNAQPAAVTGAGTICTGTTQTLSCATTGGTWSSGTPTVANVGSSTGVVTGVTAGTANISYTIGGGCASWATVTVNQTPATITGTANVCPGTTTTLACTTTGGSWSSANTATATVNSTGVVTGVAAGTVSISYTLNGCSSARTVTVNALPGAIGGGPTLCSGITTTLTCTPSGGTWSSSNTTVGTVASTTGSFIGLTGGTTTITYKLATGCQMTSVLTINPSPAAISGASTVCLGTTITLTSATSGGSWSSSNTGVATITSSGVVSGVVNGTATISYTTGSCSATKLVTVNTMFVSDTTYNMCLGITKTLIDAVPGGTWASSTPSIASVVSATGVATSFAVGMTTITYSFGAGCSKTTPLYVQNTSATISGPSAICEGASASMSVASAYMGGSWSSSNTGIATINMSTGLITGVTTGTTVITYTLIDCYTTKIVTVNPRPATITGTAFTCIGNTTTLANATSGGTWSSSAVTKATVGSTGIVTGVAAGTSTISYTLSTGCSRTVIATVSSAPASITGTTNVCVGNTINLACTSAGGTWSSSNASVASVDAAGVVSGTTPGVATISYGYGGSCTAIKAITVNPTPGSSTGPDLVCVGQSVTLSNALTGGTWASSSGATATANSATGVITGMSSGVVNITYRTTGSCITVKQVTVNAAMPAITGGTAVCVGSTVTLSTTATGGTWSSSVPAKATIDGTTGVVTGVATGSSTITYMVSTGCFKTSAMLVNSAPAAISGASSVVVGSSTTLTCATTGGAWTSSNTAVGTVTSASGAVTGISAGTMTISYTITTTGCRSTKAMTVNPTPLARGVEGADNGGIRFGVYPNPTQGTLTVETSTAGTFRIFTIDSKLIGTYHIETPSSTIQLPGDLASGIYMCQFSREDGTMETVRLIYQQ